MNVRRVAKIAESWMLVVVSFALITASRDRAFASDDPASGRISGVVLDEMGKPAGGCQVILLPPPLDGGKYYTSKYPLQETTTNDQGAFTFDGLKPGKHRVWANLGTLTSRAKGEADAVVIPEEGERSQTVDLRLAPGLTITALVKDAATGKPIPGATVHITWSGFLKDWTTDAEGRAVAGPFPPKKWQVDAWADGYAKEVQSVSLEPGSDAELTFALPPGGTIAGTVRDPDGKPVADVSVNAFIVGNNHGIAYRQTDAEGKYALEHVPTNQNLEVSVSKPDYLPRSSAVMVKQPRLPLDFTIEPRPHGGTIVGTILDPSGKPLAGAEISNVGRSSNQVRETKTDAEGKFLLDNLYEGLHGKSILVKGKGASPFRLTVEPGTPDNPKAYKITLAPGHTIKGLVTDTSGKPLDGVTIYYGGGESPFGDGGSFTTNAQGEFSSDELPLSATFSFQKDGYSPIRERALLMDMDEVVTVTMDPMGMISGQAIDAKTRKPLRSFRVQLNFSPDHQPGDPLSSLISELVDPGLNFQSDEGKFTINNLTVGVPLQVVVSAEGYERALMRRVVVLAPDDFEPLEFELAPIDPRDYRSYNGQIVRDDGKPAAGVLVRLIAAKERKGARRDDYPFNWQMIQIGQIAQHADVSRFLSATTDDQGRFTFPNVPRDQEVEIVWWGKDVSPGRADHLEQLDRKDDELIQIATPVPAKIVVTVDPKAFPRAGRLDLQSDENIWDSDDIELKADQTEYTFDNIAPGTYKVVLMSKSQPVEGRPGSFQSVP